MKVLAPSFGKVNDWQLHLEQLAQRPVLTPFDPVVIEFTDQLSKTILLDRSMRAFPEIMALAHWLRKANVLDLKRKFETRNRGQWIRPRGTVLHFAPSNVDSIFVYSLMISLFCGNANIVRVSTKMNSQLNELIRLLNSLLDKESFQSLRQRLCILTYDHDHSKTEWLSSLCNVRIVWGGDDTIRLIRSIPLPPLATELTFANRFSFAVFAVNSIYQMDQNELNQLAHRFYNDCFWFQQMACSSPRFIFWVGGESELNAARLRFWNSVDEILNAKGSELQPASYVNLISTSYQYATMKNVINVNVQENGLPTLIHVNEIDNAMRETHGGNGLFLETHVSDLENIIPWLQPQDQTMTYFGIEQMELIRFIQQIPGRQIDRIVPVGEALNFSVQWDGFDLFTQLTRSIHFIHR